MLHSYFNFGQGAHECQDLYINVCSWQQIPKPKSDQDPIPVRGGTLRNRTVQTSVQSFTASKQGQIFDLAFNPDVLEECLKDAETESMLVELSMDYIEKQVGLWLNRNSCIKLKEKCIGTKQELHGSLNEQYKHLLVRTDEPTVRLPSAASKKQPQKPNSCAGTESVTDALYNVTLADEWVGSHERGGASAPPVASASKPSGLIQEVGGEGEVVPKYRVWTEVDGSRVCVEVDLPGVNKVTEVDLDLIEVCGCSAMWIHHTIGCVFMYGHASTVCLYVWVCTYTVRSYPSGVYSPFICGVLCCVPV